VPILLCAGANMVTNITDLGIWHGAGFKEDEGAY
jgi:hypothetical protein